MPIKPANREKYPKDWRAIVARIRERAGNRCEWCGAPNGEIIVRIRKSGVWSPIDEWAPQIEVDPKTVHASDDAATWAAGADCLGTWHDERGNRMRLSELPDALGADYSACYLVRVVLTTAHLDHALVDHSDGNLAALCQRCHLTHDSAAANERRRITRLGQVRPVETLPLFAGVTA